jgi:hypothetical protein
MTVDIELIFDKFKDVFIARKEDIKSFVVKYSDRLFKEKEILFVDRIDSSNLIKISGFRTNVSSWRDPEGNPIVSTCLKEEGVEKRFDYIFHLKKEEDISQESIEEPQLDVDELDYSAISKDISKIFDESVKFSHSLQFERAIMALDSMIELLLEKNLTEYTKKLQAKRNYLKAAQDILIHRSGELQELDKKIKVLTQDNVLIKDKSQFQESITNVNTLIEELQDKAFPGYAKVLEEKKKEIEKAQDVYTQLKDEFSETEEFAESTPVPAVQLNTLKNLERMIKINKEYDQYEAAEINIERMIEILGSINRHDLVKQYTQDLEEVRVKIGK